METLATFGVSGTTAPTPASLKRGPIAKQYEHDCADRELYLARARICARLTDPSVLPPLDQQAGSKMPQNFQSIGGRGVTTMVGKMMVALWPLDVPWFSLEPAEEILNDPKVSDETKQNQKDLLNLQKFLILSKLESSDLEDGNEYRGPTPFRAAERDCLTHVLVTGDNLEYQTDDYTFKVFRRDQYVTRRDSEGNVLYHIVEESIDPKTLSKTQQDAAKLPEGWMDKPVADRMAPIWTRCEWDPSKKKWVIDQELNAETINTSDEPVSPFHCTPFKLSRGENYGRGFIELNLLGDLSSLDKLSERELDYAALASKLLTILDGGSEMREEDFAKPTGAVVRGRVENGKAVDVAFMAVEKTADMGMVFAKTERLRKEVGGAMLIESEVTPQKERTTATQVQHVAQELDNALGGMYAPISDYRQRPLLRRTIYQLRRDGKLTVFPPETVKMRVLTGLAALARANQAQDLDGLMQRLALIGPDALKEINIPVLVKVLVRYTNFNEPGLAKTPEQKEQEISQAIAAATLQKAGEQAVQTAGNIIENRAIQPQTPAAA